MLQERLAAILGFNCEETENGDYRPPLLRALRNEGACEGYTFPAFIDGIELKEDGVALSLESMARLLNPLWGVCANPFALLGVPVVARRWCMNAASIPALDKKGPGFVNITHTEHLNMDSYAGDASSSTGARYQGWNVLSCLLYTSDAADE